MDIQSLRQKNPSELLALLTEQRAHLADLRFRCATRELKNVHELRATLRMIARILTVLGEQRGVPVAAAVVGR
mgnify:CR=1 FL=1